jgi:hypothetical protein
MEGLYEEIWGEGVFEQEDTERSSSCRESVPCAPNRSLFGRALTRITTLYHPFDLAEAGVDVAAMLSCMSEAAVLCELEERGVELSITPSEAAYLLGRSEMLDEVLAGAGARPALPGAACKAGVNSVVELKALSVECLHSSNDGRRSDAPMVSAC